MLKLLTRMMKTETLKVDDADSNDDAAKSCRVMLSKMMVMMVMMMMLRFP